MPRTLEHDPRDAQPELFDDDEDTPAARADPRKHADADAEEDEGELAASVSRWLARDPRDAEEEALEDADILEARDLDDEDVVALDDDEPYDAYETDGGPDA